ncbi:putative periplasmic protein [Salmonella enterica subsp. enterica]|uniref:Putative periplasmic protein n=1 Tax=Salmonella enterica I TaxID=59201 RepID=A0A447PFV0_SALET|nr:putative periplasmic protein [Salmonella enterica subsp. enterica]
MSVIKKNIPGIGLCICAFFIHSAVGQQTVQGGVIHFRGAIVEPLCDISTHAENIDLTCLREGKKQMHRIEPSAGIWDYRRIFSPLRRYGCIISMRKKKPGGDEY